MDPRDLDRANGADEELAGAARRSYKTAVEQAFAARENNIRLARSFFEDWIETLETQGDNNRRALRNLTQVAWEQQETFFRLSWESFDAYGSFLDSLYTYHEDASKKPEEPEKDG